MEEQPTCTYTCKCRLGWKKGKRGKRIGRKLCEGQELKEVCGVLGFVLSAVYMCRCVLIRYPSVCILCMLFLQLCLPQHTQIQPSKRYVCYICIYMCMYFLNSSLFLVYTCTFKYFLQFTCIVIHLAYVCVPVSIHMIIIFAAKSGLIVKKEWILDSYIKKKRLPASKFVCTFILWYSACVHVHNYTYTYTYIDIHVYVMVRVCVCLCIPVQVSFIRWQWW